jgi:hypothetical protein
MPRGGRRGQGSKALARGGKKPLHQQLLDQVLEEFAPAVPEVAKHFAAKAKTNEGYGRFLIEFVAKYSDRQDENEAIEDLRRLTRDLVSGHDYMPEGMFDEVVKEQGADNGNERVAAGGLLESAEESRIIESDLGSAPRPVVPPEDTVGEDL